MGGFWVNISLRVAGFNIMQLTVFVPILTNFQTFITIRFEVIAIPARSGLIRLTSRVGPDNDFYLSDRIRIVGSF